MTVTLQIGALRQSVTLTGPGSPVPDGNGGFTLVYAALDPSDWRCAIEKATVQNAEQHFASTVLSRATYIVSGRYHPGIDTKSRMTWVDRSGATHVANVLDVNDTEGAGVETVALITEVVS